MLEYGRVVIVYCAEFAINSIIVGEAQNIEFEGIEAMIKAYSVGRTANNVNSVAVAIPNVVVEVVVYPPISYLAVMRQMPNSVAEVVRIVAIEAGRTVPIHVRAVLGMNPVATVVETNVVGTLGLAVVAIGGVVAMVSFG